jgi:transcriptional regulator with XRE-family HTH domain
MFSPLAIRLARQHHQMTLAQAAEMIGCGVPALSKVERGERSPSVRVLARMVDTLALDPRDLFPPGPARRTHKR